MINDPDIIQFRRLIAEANQIVFFTGAGISTESGLPDFRGPNGLWTKKKMTPIDFGDFVRHEDVRRTSWRNKFATDGSWGDAEPNPGHHAIAALVRMGKASHVITQNVDGLHQKSGIPDEQVIELHGNSNYATCLSCHRRYEFKAVKALFLPDETPPHCLDCGGIIKTATISFGQPMPEIAMEQAQDATFACDLFIAIGSTLTVYPAAAFPALAKKNGAKLVILNRDPTDLDSISDLVLHLEIGETLSAAID